MVEGAVAVAGRLRTARGLRRVGRLTRVAVVRVDFFCADFLAFFFRLVRAGAFLAAAFFDRAPDFLAGFFAFLAAFLALLGAAFLFAFPAFDFLALDFAAFFFAMVPSFE